jgi:UDP-N-acetylmuramyl-tripeptide synthetase
MQFDELLRTITDYPVVTDDTRDMVPGGVFVYGAGRALRDRFLQEALDLGAARIVSDAALPGLPPSMVIEVPDRRVASADLARRFYGDPSCELLMAGVTGTCGKTTTTYMLEAVLAEGGHEVGVIGTENIRYRGITQPSPNTTPSAFVLHRTLRTMRDAGCTAVAMEVSSHAIEHERTRGTAFDGAIFTNLSVEHLDLHGSMELYFAAKARLFTEYMQYSRSRGKSPAVAINLDDEYGRRLHRNLAGEGNWGQRLAGFGKRLPTASLYAEALEIDQKGIAAILFDRDYGESGKISIDSDLIGEFNAENMLGVAALARRMGIDSAAIGRGLSAMPPVPGRLERVGSAAETTIVVDFAHKPGALSGVLQTLRPLTNGRLICVFGCGGRRDSAKRPVMGEIAASMADLAVLTADNSRGESFDAICREILSGVRDVAKMKVIPDRREAIKFAIQMASSGDCVVIAGRGSEQQLSVQCPDGTDGLVDFDDRIVAAELSLGSAN